METKTEIQKRIEDLITDGKGYDPRVKEVKIYDGKKVDVSSAHYRHQLRIYLGQLDFLDGKITKEELAKTGRMAYQRHYYHPPHQKFTNPTAVRPYSFAQHEQDSF